MEQSSAELLGASAAVLAKQLGGHLVPEIMLRGARGGPLAPLSDQLNHDVTHLQVQRLEGMLAQLAGKVRHGLVGARGAMAVASKPVRLPLRPAFLVGREELLADLNARLSADGGAGLHMTALCGRAGAAKTSIAVQYADRHLAGLGASGHRFERTEGRR